MKGGSKPISCLKYIKPTFNTYYAPSQYHLIITVYFTNIVKLAKLLNVYRACALYFRFSGYEAMVSNTNGLDFELDELGFHPEFSEKEKALRNLFVDEYLKDYNPYAAALRCGFIQTYAQEFSKQYMAEPYVRQRIKELEASREDSTDDLQKLAISWLIREGNNFGPGASHSARVAALGNLTNVLGMKNGPTEEDPDEDESGVMVVAEIHDVEKWANAATQSQADLKEAVKQ